MEKSIDAFATWVSRSHERTQPAGNVQVSDAAEVQKNRSRNTQKINPGNSQLTV